MEFLTFAKTIFILAQYLNNSLKILIDLKTLKKTPKYAGYDRLSREAYLYI